MSKRFDRIGVYPDEMDRSGLKRCPGLIRLGRYESIRKRPLTIDCNSARLELSLILSGSTSSWSYWSRPTIAA
jgi:hypothetical protein